MMDETKNRKVVENLQMFIDRVFSHHKELICPVCGDRLQLRSAKSGGYVAYRICPNCDYISEVM